MAGTTVDMVDTVITVRAVSKVERWCYIEDWRCFVPLWFKVLGEGKYPLNPRASDIKFELVNTLSYLRSAFSDEEIPDAVRLFATKRGERQQYYNEDPEIGEEFPDNWVVNNKTAIAVCVNWPSEWKSTCTHDQRAETVDGNGELVPTALMAKQDEKISHDIKKQVDDLKINLDSKKKKHPVTGVVQVPYSVVEDAVAAAHKSGYKAGIKSGYQAATLAQPSAQESSRESAVSSSASWVVSPP